MNYSQRAYEHIQYLSEYIGGRGSCTAGETDVTFEPFNGAPSTYLPYTLAFASALMGTMLALFVGNRVALGAGALLNLLGVWAMFAESEFLSNWTRWFLPTVKTQNVAGVIPPVGTPERQMVLCAHLDSHRTPIFYSSRAWLKVFNLSVTGAFLSMAVGALIF